jgi:hypothetical protein
MSGLPRSYRTMEEFEREEIRPSFRIGFSIDDLEEDAFENELNFEMEPDDLAQSSEREDAEDEEEDEEEGE